MLSSCTLQVGIEAPSSEDLQDCSLRMLETGVRFPMLTAHLHLFDVQCQFDFIAIYQISIRGTSIDSMLEFGIYYL